MYIGHNGEKIFAVKTILGERTLPYQLEYLAVGGCACCPIRDCTPLEVATWQFVVNSQPIELPKKIFLKALFVCFCSLSV